jgi:hypothetical protein
MSILWRLGPPILSPYAVADFDWAATHRRAVACSTCGCTKQEAIRPLTFTWEDSSEEIGDFIWLKGSLVVGTRVLNVLGDAEAECFSVSPVVAVPPKRKRGGRYPQVIGDDFAVELRLNSCASWNREKSTADPVVRCDACGGRWQPEGVERRALRAIREDGAWVNVPDVIPRTPGAGLFVDRGALGSCGLFQLTGFGGEFFVDERTRLLMANAGVTNVAFSDWGEIVEPRHA